MFKICLWQLLAGKILQVQLARVTYGTVAIVASPFDGFTILLLTYRSFVHLLRDKTVPVGSISLSLGVTLLNPVAVGNPAYHQRRQRHQQQEQ